MAGPVSHWRRWTPAGWLIRRSRESGPGKHRGLATIPARILRAGVRAATPRQLDSWRRCPSNYRDPMRNPTAAAMAKASRGLPLIAALARSVSDGRAPGRATSTGFMSSTRA